MKPSKTLLSGLICLLFVACSSDGPELNQADEWIVEYCATFQSIPIENKQSFIIWCETHESLMQYSIPSRDSGSFSYESASVLKWAETTTSEAEAIQKVNDFHSIIGNNRLTTSGAKYRKYDPRFVGPWKVTFLEEFSYMHNNSEDFNKWYYENLQYLHESSFLVSEPKYQWEYPSPQNSFDFYNKSIYGHLTWVLEIQRASEKEIKELVIRFQSFSMVDNNRYDTFIADYSPITASKTFP